MSTDSYARSAEVHRVITTEFKHWASENGFGKLPGKRCCFVKHAKGNPAVVLAFEVQCSSFGGSAGGGLLTLNAGAGEIDPAYLSGPNARLLQNCSEPMAQAANLLAARILEHSPRLEDAGRPWQPGIDNWCRYYTREDVAQWGRFLVPYLSEILTGLLDRVAIAPDEFFG